MGVRCYLLIKIGRCVAHRLAPGNSARVKPQVTHQFPALLASLAVDSQEVCAWEIARAPTL